MTIPAFLEPFIYEVDGRDYVWRPGDGHVPGVFEPHRCKECGQPAKVELIVPLEIAYALVPFPTRNAMSHFLMDHKDRLPPALYKKHYRSFKRYVTLTEICICRDILISPYSKGKAPSDPTLRLLRDRAKPLPGHIDLPGDPAFGGAFEDDNESPKR